MSNSGYNYNFRLYLEGVLAPFMSATIMCTPNGVEANINMYSNKELMDIKPKTAVQIFVQDWVGGGKNAKWLLMFDGYFSSYYKTDEAGAGVSIGIQCRDFRMDIRKTPAAIVYMDKSELSVEMTTAGIKNRIVVQGVRGKAGQQEKSTATLMYDNSQLADIAERIRYISGMAMGKGAVRQSDGEYYYTGAFGGAVKASLNEVKNELADGGLFLDSVVRGMWLQSVSGTSAGAFLNKRIRADKKMFIPINKAGYNFWSRNNGSLIMASYLLGDSRFSSLEAAMMRLAGLFSVRVYSCNTPSLIPIYDKDGSGRLNMAARYVISDSVRQFLVDRASAEFGGKYILNETMLLPPLEFTSPPNCNLFFPPMYDRVVWQYDIDADMTRGYFSMVNMLTNPGGSDLSGRSYQVPNNLFNRRANEANTVDRFGRRVPPLTIEERYKGVSVFYGSVEYGLAGDDASKRVVRDTFSSKTALEVEGQIAELKKEVEEAELEAGNPFNWIGSQVVQQAPQRTHQLNEQIQAAEQVREAAKKAQARRPGFGSRVDNALNRHAMIKFINSKYIGRVATVDMAFNPYPMSGFPGCIVVDETAYGEVSGKSILGMVQQVKHQIFITPNGGDASTTVVMNNARFEDESTDMDSLGNPLYMKKTNTQQARLEEFTLDYINKDYYVPKGYPEVVIEGTEPRGGSGRKNSPYDFAERMERDGYKYAKDFLTLTAEDVANGIRNRIYVDPLYEPNKIAQFYKHVFQHKHNSFMVGVDVDNDTNKPYLFMYDTVHEALESMRKTNKDLLYSYEKAMEYVSRNICSADAFFMGVMGLSIDITTLDDSGNPVVEYICETDNFDHTRIRDEYFGVTTEDWNNNDVVQPLKLVNNGHMLSPGDLSSIRENMPYTALIKERKDAVYRYIQSFRKHASSAKV